MATISELTEDDRPEPKLWKLDTGLADDEQEYRRIFASTRLHDWFRDELPKLQSNWNVEQSPCEQLDDLLWTYGSGEPLTYGWKFNPITPIGDGVWELKTADLRVFGWFAQKDCFVGWRAEHADHIKKYNLYNGFRGETVRFRNSLPLDEPKFVAGDDPNAVISNFNYPS